MKRFALVFVLALPIILLMGCDMGGASSESVQTQVVGSITAASYTATPRSTPHPSEGQIVSLLNANLHAPPDALSQTLDASYIVIEAAFLPNPAGRLTTLSIKVRCECARDGTCCNVEHTFVVMTEAMKLTYSTFVDLVLGSVEVVQVECYDHDTRIGAMSVLWEIMKNYLIGNSTTGYQLGGAVQKNATQVP